MKQLYYEETLRVYFDNFSDEKLPKLRYERRRGIFERLYECLSVVNNKQNWQCVSKLRHELQRYSECVISTVL